MSDTWVTKKTTTVELSDSGKEETNQEANKETDYLEDLPKTDPGLRWVLLPKETAVEILRKETDEINFLRLDSDLYPFIYASLLDNSQIRANNPALVQEFDSPYVPKPGDWVKHKNYLGKDHNTYRVIDLDIDTATKYSARRWVMTAWSFSPIDKSWSPIMLYSANQTNYVQTDPHKMAQELDDLIDLIRSSDRRSSD